MCLSYSTTLQPIITSVDNMHMKVIYTIPRQSVSYDYTPLNRKGRTIWRLIMHVESQRTLSKAPFLLDNSRGLIPYTTQHRQVHLPQIAQRADRIRQSDCNEVKWGDCREIPFHVGKDNEPILRCRRSVQDFLGFGFPRQYVEYPVCLLCDRWGCGRLVYRLPLSSWRWESVNVGLDHWCVDLWCFLYHENCLFRVL